MPVSGQMQNTMLTSERQVLYGNQPLIARMIPSRARVTRARARVLANTSIRAYNTHVYCVRACVRACVRYDHTRHGWQITKLTCRRNLAVPHESRLATATVLFPSLIKQDAHM